ncbi:MAG: RibD family protein [Verrucomicrobiota bacterium]
MKRPYLIGKAAFSLDGYMSRPAQDGPWLTSETARADANRLRTEVDAVMVGANTARIDNPQLTVREVEVAIQPYRLVLTQSGNVPADLNLLTDSFSDRSRILSPKNWNDLWQQCQELGIRRILVEGGGNLLNQFASDQLIDESVIYYAPFNLENKDLVRADHFRKLELINPSSTAVGPDLKIRGLVHKL